MLISPYLLVTLWLELQKQPFADVLQNRRSLKFRNIHRETPALDSLFNIFTGPKPWNFIKKGLQHRCFPRNIAKLLRATFFIVHLWWLLPELTVQNHMSFWTVTFSAYGSVCLGFSWTATSETILTKNKQPSSFRKYAFSIFSSSLR